MSKNRNRLPEPPVPAPKPPEPKPLPNGLVIAKPTPSCSNCPCWHRSSNGNNDQTCRYNEAQRSPGDYMNRQWPHTVGSDSCWRHPALRARYLQAVQEELGRLQALPDFKWGASVGSEAKNSV